MHVECDQTREGKTAWPASTLTFESFTLAQVVVVVLRQQPTSVASNDPLEETVGHLVSDRSATSRCTHVETEGLHLGWIF